LAADRNGFIVIGVSPAGHDPRRRRLDWRLQPLAERTVGAGFARGLLAFAVSKAASREALLARSGIDADALADQDARLPFSRYVALMRAAKALTGDPALALHYGEAVSIADVSIVGLIGLAAESLREGLGQLNRYVPLIVETDNAGDVRFEQRREADGVWVIDTRRDAEAFPELTESAFAQLISQPRRQGFRSFAQAICVTHADPGYAGEYERVLGAPVTFDAGRNAFRIDSRADAPAPPRPGLPPYVFGVLSERAQTLLEELEDAQSTRGRVERLLMAILHKGDVGMEALARRMGVSRQTLFRRLKAEGVTYEAVLDALRRRLAVDYLTGRKVSVNETAYLLGFSEPAAFSRAFKRWTGLSPQAFRRL
jgi:AraC-like DNA-binding protein